MNGRTGELRALTGARGIAAWLVMLYHIRLSIAGLPAPAVLALGKGYLAVDFFFLLSGFVIWLAWHERLRPGPGGGGSGAARRFWIRRIARVWPLHLAMLGSAIVLALALAATGRDGGGRFPAAELPLHLLLVQDWGFTDRLSWNDPAWSISAEWAAYLLFPPLVAMLDWRRLPTPAILAALAALFVLLHGLFARHGATSLGYDIARMGLARCFVEFAAGTATCALWMRWRDRLVVPAILAACCATGAIAATAAGLLPETLAVPFALATLLLTLALTSGLPGNPLAGRWLHLLGEISFATYLSHFLLFFVFKLAVVDDARAIPPLLVAMYLVVVLMASWSLHHLVERPARRWVEELPGRLPAWPGRAGRRRSVVPRG
ncbi:acyltransferase family protein [Sphingomonas bacterium]|uniref:acyltransferase family protein n=1 Tax=Sphingomonas bacterium TaxID=1895847 RepID=UPI0015751FAE|nr:acyltransferase [Sphingomonas bacterium]